MPSPETSLLRKLCMMGHDIGSERPNTWFTHLVFSYISSSDFIILARARKPKCGLECTPMHPHKKAYLPRSQWLPLMRSSEVCGCSQQEPLLLSNNPLVCSVFFGQDREPYNGRFCIIFLELSKCYSCLCSFRFLHRRQISCIEIIKALRVCFVYIFMYMTTWHVCNVFDKEYIYITSSLVVLSMDNLVYFTIPLSNRFLRALLLGEGHYCTKFCLYCTKISGKPVLAAAAKGIRLRMCQELNLISGKFASTYYKKWLQPGFDLSSSCTSTRRLNRLR